MYISFEGILMQLDFVLATDLMWLLIFYKLFVKTHAIKYSTGYDYMHHYQQYSTLAYTITHTKLYTMCVYHNVWLNDMFSY